MTEAEWQACPDPQRMLAHLGDRADERTRRRFTCACCRRAWDLLGKEGRRYVRLVEQWADDQLDAAALRRAVVAAGREATAAQQVVGWRNLSAGAHAPRFARLAAYEVAVADSDCPAARSAAAALAIRVVGANPIDENLTIGVGADRLVVHLRPTAYGVQGKAAEQTAFRRRTAELEDAWGSERRVQADILRCLAPWAPVPAFDPRWRTADVLGLARAAREDEAFDRLPLLADALMDAGCDRAEALAHCRSGGPHVRGCWLLERILASADAESGRT